MLWFILINYVCSVYGRGRKLDRAVEMFNTARSLGLCLDEKAYMNLISYYGKAGMVPLLPSFCVEAKKKKKRKKKEQRKIVDILSEMCQKTPLILNCK